MSRNMKAFMNKIVCLALVAFTFASAWAQTSQLEEKTLPVGDFASVSVTDDFEVSLVKGACGVKVTTEKDLFPYIQVYVRSKVLYITYDEKSVPKEIRKNYRSKGSSSPVFRAVVYLPEISGITLANNVTLTSSDEFKSNSFEMNLGDKSQVRNLSLRTGNAVISMKKNAQATLTVRVDNRLDVNADGNANLKLTAESPEMVMNFTGSSDAVIVSEGKTSSLTMAGSANVSLAHKKAEKFVLQMGGTSKLNLSGEAELLQVKGERSALVEANDFSVKKLEANLNGGIRVNVAVSEKIDATLVGGSAVYYTGTPTIQIGKIIKSTLAPYGSTAK